MSQINRLPSGGYLNRSKPLRFWYDGTGYQGYPGDTLASALLANGVTVVGRSFKYHRPRGVYSAGCEEPNALVQLEAGAYTEPNRPATEIELYDGLTARSQNCWPSVRFDLGAVGDRFARLLPAGFYYKTFMWPKSMWLWYEKYIRKAAGLGHAPTQPDPDRYDKIHAHCDVLVVGGGPAGLRAAHAAGGSGARVMLLDDRPEFGGALLSEHAEINRKPALQWVAGMVAELKNMPEVVLLNRTTVSGYYDYNFLVASQRVAEHLGPHQPDTPVKQRLWKIRARQVVLATGAIERPLVFADNDRPGVMLAGALGCYINRYGVLPGRHICMLTNNDSAYPVALDAHRAGARVELIDLRAQPHSALIEQVRAQFDGNLRIHTNSTITGVDYAGGKIRRVELMQLSPDGSAAIGAVQTRACDLIAVSGGWTPSVHLFSQARGQLRFLAGQHCFVPGEPSVTSPAQAAGACTGGFTLHAALEQGSAAGAGAAAACGRSAAAAAPTDTDEPATAALRPLWILPTDHPIGQGPKKHFHELHNDATVADLQLAAREGFESIEHVKRYTTTGMGTDQGKTANMNALEVIANLTGTPVPALGTTTYRPPYTPLTLGAIVGHDRRALFLQQRKTPMHAWHDKQGAVYEDVGDWKRPFYFPLPGEGQTAAVQRECRAVRQSVGLLDASTLGKIDIRGADAARLLDLVYTNNWRRLAPGRCRYGLMLNQHGMVFDDGVTACLAEHHYHMTTTSGGAARVLNWLEEWLQTEWPDMQVYCTSVTEQWAVASLNGPNSDRVLGALCDQALDDAAFPLMSVRECTVAGIPARVFRVSFSGERAFEINVPARYGLALWAALMAAGKPYDIRPYGTEAMHILRAEKGFIIVGQDTDGTTTPIDLGMERMIAQNKPDFLGKRSLLRSDTRRSGRKQLVGLLTDDPDFVLPEGAQVVEQLQAAPPMQMLGHVSSSYMSPNVGRSIAMALVEDGFNRHGQSLTVPLIDGSHQRVTVTKPVFLAERR